MLLRKMLRVLGVFVSFFLALFGASLIARGLEVARGPLTLPREGWSVYHLELSDTFAFYAGCAIVAASLTFLWSQRCKTNYEY
jgi:hypothetical protein